jgi:hypothetical protein
MATATSFLITKDSPGFDPIMPLRLEILIPDDSQHRPPASARLQVRDRRVVHLHGSSGSCCADLGAAGPKATSILASGTTTEALLPPSSALLHPASHRQASTTTRKARSTGCWRRTTICPEGA